MNQLNLENLLGITDGDTPIIINENFDDVFEGYPRDLEEEIPQTHLQRPVKAMYYSTLRKALVLEI